MDLENFECYIIESKANSTIGEARHVAYFNPKYGFVKLDYTNMDGSKTNLKLTEHSERKNKAPEKNGLFKYTPRTINYSKHTFHKRVISIF